jgi:hypothetical protein
MQPALALDAEHLLHAAPALGIDETRHTSGVLVMPAQVREDAERRIGRLVGRSLVHARTVCRRRQPHIGNKVRQYCGFAPMRGPRVSITVGGDVRSSGRHIRA